MLLVHWMMIQCHSVMIITRDGLVALMYEVESCSISIGKSKYCDNSIKTKPNEQLSCKKAELKRYGNPFYCNNMTHVVSV